MYKKHLPGLPGKQYLSKTPYILLVLPFMSLLRGIVVVGVTAVAGIYVYFHLRLVSPYMQCACPLTPKAHTHIHTHIHITHCLSPSLFSISIHPLSLSALIFHSMIVYEVHCILDSYMNLFIVMIFVYTYIHFIPFTHSLL